MLEITRLPRKKDVFWLLGGEFLCAYVGQGRMSSEGCGRTKVHTVFKATRCKQQDSEQ